MSETNVHGRARRLAILVALSAAVLPALARSQEALRNPAVCSDDDRVSAASLEAFAGVLPSAPPIDAWDWDPSDAAAAATAREHAEHYVVAIGGPSKKVEACLSALADEFPELVRAFQEGLGRLGTVPDGPPWSLHPELGPIAAITRDVHGSGRFAKLYLSRGEGITQISEAHSAAFGAPMDDCQRSTKCLEIIRSVTEQEAGTADEQRVAE